jgi:hypothetical protein
MDWRIVLKFVLTAGLIVAISEIGKRFSFAGAILASLPLTSLLALTWLYLDTKDSVKTADLSMDIFYAVIPSLVFFPVLSVLLRNDFAFPISMLYSVALTALAYFIFFWLMNR